MESALERLQKLVLSITDGKEQNAEFSKQSDIPEEILCLKNFLILEAYKADIKSVELLVQSCQASVIDAMDMVNSYYSSKPVSDTNHSCEKILESLNSFLSFIEAHFSRYFNLDEKVPDIYCQHSRDLLDLDIKTVKQFLNKQGIDQVIQQIALMPLVDFIRNKGSACSYRHLIYLKSLVKELKELGKLSKDKCLYSALIELLVYMNFNSIQFINYFTSTIIDSIKNEHKEQRKKTFSFHLKEINQMHTRPGVSLYPDFPTVKDQVRNFLLEEINYLTQLTPNTAPKLTEQWNAKNVFIVHKGASHIPVRFDDICYFYRDGDYNFVRAFEGESFFIPQPLDEIEQLIDEQNFFRVNRQFMVNRMACKNFRDLDFGKLELFVEPPFKQPIIISQKRAKAFKEWMEQ